MKSGQFKQRAFVKKFVSNLVIIFIGFSFLFCGFPLGGPLCLDLGVQKALAANADHVVISEAQTGRTGATTNDFIELYNPTPSAINLKGLRLVRRAQTATTDTTIKSWTTDTFIPANGFYLWANSGYSAIAVAPDTTTTSTIADNNSIALRQGPENTGTIIDGLAWGSGHVASIGERTPLQNISPDKSLERKANALSTQASMGIGGLDELKGNAWDTDDNSADFVLSANSQPQNSLSLPENPLDTQIRITGDPSKPKNVKQRIQISGNAGDVLTLSGWNKTEGVSARGGFIGVIAHLNNTDGTMSYKLMGFNKDSHDWMKNTINITASKNYSSIDIVAVNNYQTGVSYFDGLMLLK